MDGSLTRRPTRIETLYADAVSKTARDLVQSYANQILEGCEWQNTENVANTRVHLLAYISQLEGRIK